MTKPEFSVPFMAMCEMKGKSMSDVGKDLYYETVKHLDNETWNMAVRRVMASHKYAGIPQAAEILEASGMNEDKDADALLAIETIKQTLLSGPGPAQTMVFDDPIIHMLIATHDGGWPGLCAGTIEEHKWLWKDWIKLYKAFTVRPVSYPNRLIGTTERDNSPEALKVNCGACHGGKLGPCQRCGGTGYIDTGRNMVSYTGDRAKCLEIEGDETLQIGG